MPTAEERITTLEAENAALRAQVAELATLRAQVQELQTQNQELQARLAKDSHNSSKPPSSDGLKRQLPRTRSLRRTTGKKPGGQLGHLGETLHLVAEPDAVVEHRPAICSACQAAFTDEVGAQVVTRERRQVHDLPAGYGAMPLPPPKNRRGRRPSKG